MRFILFILSVFFVSLVLDYLLKRYEKKHNSYIERLYYYVIKKLQKK